MQELKRERDRLTEILRVLVTHSIVLSGAKSSAEEKLRERETALKTRQGEIAKDERDKASRKGWFAFLWTETPGEKEKRERDATARRTGMFVIEAQVQNYRKELDKKEELLKSNQAQIVQARSNMERASAAYDFAESTESRRRQEEKWAKDAENARKERQRQEAEYRAKAEEEHKRRQQAAEERERQRQVIEELRRKQEAAAKKAAADYEKMRREQEATNQANSFPQSNKKPAKRKNNNGAGQGAGQKSSSGGSSNCHHRGWWQQIPGPAHCERCHRRTPHFRFECPSCSVKTCASCRFELKKR